MWSLAGNFACYQVTCVRLTLTAGWPLCLQSICFGTQGQCCRCWNQRAGLPGIPEALPGLMVKSKSDGHGFNPPMAMDSALGHLGCICSLTLLEPNNYPIVHSLNAHWAEGTAWGLCGKYTLVFLWVCLLDPLTQGSTNHSPWTNFNPLPIFVQPHKLKIVFLLFNAPERNQKNIL